MSLLLDTKDPCRVLQEVSLIAVSIDPDFDKACFRRVFDDIVRLFKGEYPGYRSCNTEYHDLKHTTDVLLSMSRLMHGFALKGCRIQGRTLLFGLISALMHDTGYIQTSDDTEGTGAKYTAVHVRRSIGFMTGYFETAGFKAEDAPMCARIISATDTDIRLCDIPFVSDEEELTGKALFAADILGQMADRMYLENLRFLFREFMEGLVRGYSSEDEFLRRTIEFYEMIRSRLETEIGYSDAFMRSHFTRQWDIDCDLYLAGLEKNISYLKKILQNCQGNYSGMLRRGGTRRMQGGPGVTRTE